MSLRYKITKIAVLFAGMIMLGGVSYADYSFSRYPLASTAKVTATFGQFREYYNSSGKITYVGGHEGMDLDDVTNAPIYSVAPGELVEYRDKPKEGYGNVLRIHHTAIYPEYQTFYAHMSNINKLSTIIDKNLLGEKYYFNTTDPIGYVGSTGGGASTGSHLHFQVGNPAIGGGQENPLAAGLDQPYANYMQTTIEAYDDALFPGNAFIRLLGPGDDGKFDRLNYVKSGAIYNKIEDPGENEEINYPEAGKPIKIVVEAYQNSLLNGFRTAPYGVEFNISEIGGSYSKSEIIRFNKKLSEINNEIDKYYCFTKPFVTKPKSTADYYYLDWTPGEGVYKIQVKVYVAYRESGVLKFQTPIIKERIVSIGLAGIDYDAPYGYAFAQYDPNTGLPGAGGGVRVAGAGDDEPTIYYTDISAPRFSISPGETTYPKNTVISARADRNVNWTVRIFDENGGPAATLTSAGDRLSKKWVGSGDGKYTYQVEAQDPTSGEKAEKEGLGIIIVDNQPPDITLKSDSTINITTSEAKAVVEFTANEDLAFARVDIVDIAGVSIAEYFKVQPHLKKDELFQAEWANPWANANGWYYLKIFAFDLAGNRTVKYVPVRVDLPGGVSPTTTAPTEPIKRTNPPDEIKNIAVGDIDFDEKGNMYVLYTKQMKLVKYDGSGKEVGKIEKFGSDSQDYFWYPQGLAVSPSGDRIYVADTYADRVLIFDSALNLIKAIQGRDVFLEYVRDEHDDVFIIKYGHYTNHYRYEMLEEGFNLPKGVGISGEYAYVTDTEKHRVLKYDLNGNEVVFDKLEGRHGSNDDNSCYHYTNSLNETKDDGGHRMDRYGYSAFNAMDAVPHPNVMIHEISVTGNGTGGGGLTIPEAACAQASGSVYVADTGNNRIQVFNPDGSYQTKFGEGILSSPKGIDVDSLGNIWVADTGNHRIVQFDTADHFVKAYPGGESFTPLKVKARDGKLYIADANSSRLLIWDVAGNLSEVWGSDKWFSPNGDGKKDSLIVHYRISQPAEITVSLIPKASAETDGIIAINKTSCGIGTYEVTWDGKAADGSTIADGEYILKVIAEFGDYVKSATFDVAIDTTGPALTQDLAPPAISPNGDGISDYTLISYTISDDFSPSSDTNLYLWKNGVFQDVLFRKSVALSGSPPHFSASLVWDGKIEGKVLEGNYLLNLRATDLAGNTSDSVKEVQIEIQPPRITNVTLSNANFSPNGDGRKDNTELNFNLSDNYSSTMETIVWLENASGDRIKTLADTVLASGPYSYVWSGKSDDGNVVPDGTYKLVISAKDWAGNTAITSGDSIVVDTIPPTINKLTASPNPFTPNNDGVKDFTVFSYNFSELCDTELNILRVEDKAPFRVYRQHGISSGSFKWDGTGDRGGILGQEHPFYLAAEDLAGNLATSEPQAISVDYTPSLVPYAFAETDPFSPATGKSTAIKYYLTRNDLAVSVDVLGKEGRVVKHLLTSRQDKGEQSVVWQGDFDSGYDGPRASKDTAKVADGNWQFRVTAASSDETNPAVVTNTVLVDNVPPFITLRPVETNYVLKKARVRYTLPETAVVDVKVYDSEDNLVAVLASGETKPAGEQQVIYDFPVPGNSQYFQIIAIDKAMNSDEKRSESFLINPGELRVLDHSASPSTFTPNNDGHSDSTNIVYTLKGGVPPYRVSVNILTPLGMTMRRLADNEIQYPGQWTFSWLSQPLEPLIPDGYYQYQVLVEDSIGTTTTVNGNILAVSTRPTVDLNINYPTFSPDGDGQKDMVTVNYTVNYPTFYLSGSALVKLRVLNTNGEVLWEKGFSQPAGSYNYEYSGETINGQNLQAGNYYLAISGTDALGSQAITKLVPFTVDYTDPAPSNFSIQPSYARLGSEVTVSLNFDEALAETPTVKMTMSDGTERSVYLKSNLGNNYLFSYVIGNEDTEGPAKVIVDAKDKAFNQISKISGFVIDKTLPTISDIQITPNPASLPSVNGQLSVKFKVNEQLLDASTVVAQQNASPQLAIVSGDKATVNGQYEGKYSVFAGNDGTAVITIEVVDLAGNSQMATRTVEIDTVKPNFTLHSQIVANPDFNLYARENSEVSITINSSEKLKFNPDVRVNDNPCAYLSLDQANNEYLFKYVVNNGDLNGVAKLTVNGFDLAGNEGMKEASSTGESFVVDLIKPTVAIAAPETDMIANPSPFTTNGANDVGHRQTTLRYETSEYGNVTVSIHRIPNTLEAYTRQSFTGDNLVASFNEGWLTEGEHQQVWNGIIYNNQTLFDQDSNGFADPGKYAFIVEVKDRAGNVIEGKWGGTCWVQDNVLSLEQPDQTEIGGTNPRPRYFSPNGDGSMESTAVWFRVKLGVAPAEPKRPERIGVMGIPQDFKWVVDKKLIGNYTVRVYNENKSALIRTIIKDEPLNSNIIISEGWDGRYGTGSDKLTPGAFVPEGNYLVEVDARDFINGAAENNLFSLMVTVDTTAPTVVNHETGEWLKEPKAYNVDFYDNQNSSSKLKTARYSVWTGPNQTGALVRNWTDIFTDSNASLYENDWGSELFSYCVQGANYVSVWVSDNAGNETLKNDLFITKKDTEAPSTSAPSTTSPTNNKRPTWSWTAGSDMSGIQGYYIRVGTSPGVGNVYNDVWVGNVSFWQTASDLADNTYYASIKAIDGAGNIGDYSSFGQVKVDTTPPQITAISASPNPCSPGRVDGRNDLLTVNFTLNEVATVKIYIDGNEYNVGGVGAGASIFNHPNPYPLSQGTHNYYIVATDTAQNFATSATYSFSVDNIPPAAPTGLFLSSINGAATLSWKPASDNNLSGYNIYRSNDIYGTYSQVSGLTATTSYLDSGLTNGVKYWYKVKAVDTAGNESEAFSNYAMARPGQISLAKIIYQDGAWDVYKANGDLSSPVRLTNDSTGNTTPTRMHYSSPADWLANGEILYFTDEQDWPSYPNGVKNYNYYLRIMNSDGTNQRTIYHWACTANSWFQIASPIISPDGTKIAYGKSTSELRLMNADGSGDHVLASVVAGASCYPSSFSIDNTKIYYTVVSSASNYQIYVVNVDGTGNQLLINDPSKLYYLPILSPDGTRLAFKKSNGSAWELWQYHIFTGEQTILSGNGDSFGGWKPNGDIFYTRKTLEKWSPFVVNPGSLSVRNNPATFSSPTIEAPILLAPTKDRQDVQNIRPAFEWQHHKADTTEYRVEVARNDSFSIDHQTFSKAAGTGTQDKADTNLYTFNYAIHEFDPGLERNTDYFWKVTALSPTNAATSETWGFRIQPELTLVGVTNYPNPFNPNREQTKIRYRLSADADEVRIRIYDITGYLVTELDGTTNGEGMSVWQKYNDVSWDGRNGRGDLVVNGIYPFEITARIGDKTVSGRGKIAVLK